MKRVAGVLLGLITLVLVLSCQDNKRANNYNMPPIDDEGLLFFTNATEASLTNVKASGLVISNSKNLQVIQFAKLMIDEHTQLAVDLKKLQTDNFITPKDSINAMHQQMIADLKKKRAGIFDKTYIQEVINEYEQQIILFNAASLNKNINVSDFAKKTLPVLKAHLDSAKVISLILK
jgi:putative membrane protein